MEIPEHLRELVDRLGHALVDALANDEESRALVTTIQTHGFDLALMLEATVALRQRDPKELPGAFIEGELNLGETGGPWSEADKAFLRTFKIAL